MADLDFPLKRLIKYAALIIIIIVLFNYMKNCYHSTTDNIIATAQQTIDSNPIAKMLTPKSIKQYINKKSSQKLSTDIKNMTPDQIYEQVPNKFKFDIHLDLGLYSNFFPPDVDMLLPKPGVGISLFSYGKSKKDTKLRFGRIGVGGWTNSGLDVTIAPVMVNVGIKIPILSNTYVYPQLGYNLKHNKVVLGAGISLSF